MYFIGDSISPDEAMKYALKVAEQGLGFVSPNPLVGCVIVDKDHQFIGAGAHLKFGEAHAEVNALAAVQDKQTLEGATLYVTLEPCSHQGQTPPCAETLAKTPIAKVVYGTQDPNPQVSGRGADLLKRHGKVVESFPQYRKECQKLCESFMHHIQNQSPYVVMKAATSLDGQIALKSGESQWITGEEARLQGRRLRAHYDATLIGAGTLQYDDPTLDFRGTEFENKKSNKIVILDPKGKAAEHFKSSKIAKTHETKNIFVLTRSEHKASWATNLNPVIEWSSSKSGWERTLKNLYQKGIASLYVEGGSYAFSQLLQYQLAHKLYLFQSNKILGNGLGWTRSFELKSLGEAPTLNEDQVQRYGEDTLRVFYF
jgi:diaminohydroxyphosphoribosylaminopyrimidine deaminase/5-amino-6-(5-phosphoribosylamino)uracil reductase